MLNGSVRVLVVNVNGMAEDVVVEAAEEEVVVVKEEVYGISRLPTVGRYRSASRQQYAGHQRRSSEEIRLRSPSARTTDICFLLKYKPRKLGGNKDNRRTHG